MTLWPVTCFSRGAKNCRRSTRPFTNHGVVDWNRAPNNYDKIALVIRQIRASQDRVQRLRMVVPVWRCDAEAPVALLPPAPLRPLSVTSLTSRWTTGPTGAGAAPCALDVAYSATASLAVRRNDSAAPARWVHDTFQATDSRRIR